MIVKILAGLLPIKSWRRSFRQFCYSVQIRFVAKSIGKGFECLKFSTVNKNTIIGKKVRLNGCHISGKGNVHIGDNSVIGFETLIISDTHNYKGNYLPYDGEFITKDIIIGDFVWVGARVIILPGSHIGEGAIIQAGSVVHGEIPPLAIAGGNPAKVFMMRNENHYNYVKKRMLN